MSTDLFYESDSEEDDDLPLSKIRNKGTKNTRKNIEKTRCKGITKNNQQCLRFIIKDDYCKAHINQKNQREIIDEKEREQKVKIIDKKELDKLTKDFEDRKIQEDIEWKKRNKINEIIYEKQKNNKYLCLNELKNKFENERKKQKLKQTSEKIKEKKLQKEKEQLELIRKLQEEKEKDIPIELKFKEDYCCICSRDFDSNYTPIKPCFHWVHKSCMIKFGSQNCPYCRTQVNFNQRQLRELKLVQEQKKKEKEEQERNELIRLYHQRVSDFIFL